MIHSKTDNPDYDVVITGGALAGASSAILLKRERPDLRVLVIERSPAFRRRVGEATVEISGYFLTRVLGLMQYLNQNHLIKQGFRFWMTDAQTRTLGDCSEIGAKYQTRVPSFLIDRAELDEEVLRRAEALGVEVWRPAQVKSIVLLGGGLQTLLVRRGEGGNDDITLRCRWVIDASGVAAHLARQNQWAKPNTDHPTTAVWARWTNVGDWDDPKLAEQYPDWNRNFFGIRGTATNHFMGDGWWAWFIRLKNGDVSIGVLYDQRLVDWPTAPQGLAAQLKAFLDRHPAAQHMLEHAEVVDGDIHLRRNLAWSTDTFAGDGFALVSDAAGFLDPFYSPGLDWLSFTVSASTRLILDGYQKPETLSKKIEQHNQGFSRAYRYWFLALYKDKYTYLGDFELLKTAFRLDLGLYYMGVVTQPYWRGPRSLEMPMFSEKVSRPFAWLMRTYNRRLAAMAMSRRKRGTFGRHNHGKRFHFAGYGLTAISALTVVRAVMGWFYLELTEGWRSWGKSVAIPTRNPATSQPAAPAPDHTMVPAEDPLPAARM